MSQLIELQIAPQVYAISWRTEAIGHVVRGQLIELRNGGIVVRGRTWHIVGWEYQEFRSLNDAAAALLTRHLNLRDAHEEVNEVKRLETFIPYAKRVARRAKKRSIEKKVSRDMKRAIRQLRSDYCESLRRASLGSGNFNTQEMGGGG